MALLLLVWQFVGTGTADTPAAAPTTTRPLPTGPGSPIATTVSATQLRALLPTARSLTAATFAGDTMIIAGGLNSGRKSTSTLWSWTPDGRKVTKAGSLPRAAHAAAAAPLGGMAVFFGGGTGDRADRQVLGVTADGDVSELGMLPTPRTNATAVPATDGTSVLLAGGIDGSEPTNDVLRTRDGRTFETVATLLAPTRFPAVATLGQTVWVIGGEYNKALIGSVQRIDLGAPGVPATVTESSPLPLPLSRASAFVVGGSIFVAGGRTADGRSNQVYRIDPVTGAVTVAGSLPAPWSDGAVAVVDNAAYLIGGITPQVDKDGATVSAPTKRILRLTPNI